MTDQNHNQKKNELDIVIWRGCKKIEKQNVNINWKVIPTIQIEQKQNEIQIKKTLYH